MTSVIAGIGWHIVGASMAASFYAPIERVKKWSWETTWALAGLFSWVLLPIGVSLVLLPNFHSFYAAMSTSLLLRVAAFGAMWGVGNVSYGLTMRYLGMSLGIGVATYITIADSGGGAPTCLAGGGGCETVANSSYSHIAGINVAVFGIIGYVALLLSAFFANDAARFGGFAVSLGGFGFSVYLTYLELFKIEAICQWCIASDVVMVLLACACVGRVLAARDP